MRTRQLHYRKQQSIKGGQLDGLCDSTRAKSRTELPSSLILGIALLSKKQKRSPSLQVRFESNGPFPISLPIVIVLNYIWCFHLWCEQFQGCFMPSPSANCTRMSTSGQKANADRAKKQTPLGSDIRSAMLLFCEIKNGNTYSVRLHVQEFFLSRVTKCMIDPIGWEERRTNTGTWLVC